MPRVLAKRPFLVALVLSALPYVVLRLYVSGVMHGENQLAGAPGAGFLTALLVVGAVAPAAFVGLVLRRLIAERDAFQLRGLLEVYASVVLVFGVTYAVLQASSLGPAFSGMPVVWEAGAPASAADHVARLHAVFGNALYLSVVSMTTVGYGDIAPLGFAAKLLAGLQGLLGIGFVGLVLGQYFAACIRCAPQVSAQGPSTWNPSSGRQ